MNQKPNTAEPEKSRRRWYQFRLRTLLIGMTLLGSVCGTYVSREAKTVAERMAWKNRPPLDYSHPNDWKTIQVRNSAVDPSLIRRWLGDYPTEFLLVHPGGEVK